MKLFLVACVLLLLQIEASNAANPLTVPEQLGKRIYQQGIGSEPNLSALAAPGIEAPATEFACIKCHGGDGAGGSEGGVQVADISHARLAIRYSTGQVSRFDDRALILRAIREGKDASGNALNMLMPRYKISDKDSENLLAYLKRLGDEPVPGVDEKQIRIGVLRPSAGPLKELGDHATRLLRAYFAPINSSGGLYGREIRVIEIPFNAERDNGAQAAIASLSEPVFCLISTLAVLPDSPAQRWLDHTGIPNLAPIGIAAGFPAISSSTYHIYASVFDQARVMVDQFAVRDEKKKRPALVYIDDTMGQAAAAGVRTQAKVYGLKLAMDRVIGQRDAGRLVTDLRVHQVSDVFVFGPELVVRPLFAEAKRRDVRVRFWISVDLTGSAILDGSKKQRLLIQPVTSLVSPEANSANASDLRALVADTSLPSRYYPFYFPMYAGAQLLEQSLRRSGRAVTRQTFSRRLESIYRFQTGVTPELSFASNQHIGTQQVLVYRRDSRTGEWRTSHDIQEPR